MSKLLYEFEADPRRLFLKCQRICLASYQFDQYGGLSVWVNQVDNPTLPVMFLMTGAKYSPGKYTQYPHNFVTDGERWHPLIEGNRAKYLSYPSGYDGYKLTRGDLDVISGIITAYVRTVVGARDGQ